VNACLVLCDTNTGVKTLAPWLTPLFATFTITMIEIEWDTHDSNGRRHHPRASTIHGWITKWRGTLFGSEATRRQGIREMKQASAIRKYEHQRDAERRARIRQERGLGGVISFVPASRRPSRLHKDRREVVVQRDYSDGHDRSRSRRHHSTHGEEPWLHSSRRTKPHHHGHGTQIKGYLTGNHDLVEQGKEMTERAHREREREKRRRRRRAKREAANMRGSSNRFGWHE